MPAPRSDSTGGLHSIINDAEVTFIVVSCVGGPFGFDGRVVKKNKLLNRSWQSCPGILFWTKATVLSRPEYVTLGDKPDSDDVVLLDHDELASIENSDLSLI